MNRCAYQQKKNMFGDCGGREMSRGDSICVSDGVVCPKPRRLGPFNPSSVNNDHIRPSRFHFINPPEVYESRAGTELLDIILSKGNYGAEKPSTQVASSPPFPFLCGSPPSRASNPVIQDAQFGNEKVSPLSPASEASPYAPSARKNGGCVRMKFGQKPAAVRIEGFNCRGNCSISAVA